MAAELVSVQALVPYYDAGAQVSTCNGVGSNPLHGLFSWGQLLIKATTSVSARIST
jgi:hypothetical protein